MKVRITLMLAALLFSLAFGVVTSHALYVFHCTPVSSCNVAVSGIHAVDPDVYYMKGEGWCNEGHDLGVDDYVALTTYGTSCYNPLYGYATAWDIGDGVDAQGYLEFPLGEPYWQAVQYTYSTQTCDNFYDDYTSPPAWC